MTAVTPNSLLRPYYLDASVLVKLVIEEPGSAAVRSYVFDAERSWRICTSFCFIESLGAVKLKKVRNEISDNGYIVGCRKLLRLVREGTIRILETEISTASKFAESERMVKAYNIDFLDAFQILSVKTSWPQLAAPSKPLLVTADGTLAKVGRCEGIECLLCRNP